MAPEYGIKAEKHKTILSIKTLKITLAHQIPFLNFNITFRSDINENKNYFTK